MRNSEKTHCPREHPYSGENLMRVAGRRVCRTCHRESSRKYADRPGHGQRRGSEHGKARLTEAQVREIRRDYVPRVVSHAKLAARYGVGPGTIQNVLNRTTWRHVV